MRTIDSVLESLGLGYTDENVKVLQEYANEIVDLCAGSFECEMDIDGVPGYESEYPVLVRQSIYDVKQKIV